MVRSLAQQFHDFEEAGAHRRPTSRRVWRGSAPLPLRLASSAVCRTTASSACWSKALERQRSLSERRAPARCRPLRDASRQRPDRSRPIPPGTAGARPRIGPCRLTRGRTSCSSLRNQSRRAPRSSSLHSPASSRAARRGERDLRGQPQDVLLVEPVEFLGIEDGVAAADPLERERRNQLVAA